MSRDRRAAQNNTICISSIISADKSSFSTSTCSAWLCNSSIFSQLSCSLTERSMPEDIFYPLEDIFCPNEDILVQIVFRFSLFFFSTTVISSCSLLFSKRLSNIYSNNDLCIFSTLIESRCITFIFSLFS